MKDGPELRIANLTAQAGSFRLECDLTCARWPLVLLGPSGAGKTLLLRLLAGLDSPRSGRIEFDGVTWFSQTGAEEGSRRSRVLLPADQRSIGYCLQDPLLFPHLTVLENIAYPLRNSRPRLRPEERRHRALEELERWGGGSLSQAVVHGLSGGEQGRVGLARAFVRRPQLLLLDEPLAALDPPSREELSVAVRRALQDEPRPVIWVTHDRNEALALGETLVVLLGGRVAQSGPAEEIFRRPSGPEVASFVGVGTILHGLVQAREAGVMRIRCGPIVLRAVGNLAPGTPVVAAIRSEDVELQNSGGPAHPPGSPFAPAAAGSPVSSARNELAAVVTAVRTLGLTCLVELDAGVPLTAAVTRPAVEELALAAGRPVIARIKAVAVQVRSEGWLKPAAGGGEAPEGRQV